jgi:membrane protein
VYGSLASIPIFLIWLSIQWFIVLLAVEIASLHQYRNSRTVGSRFGGLDPSGQMATGLSIYLEIARRLYRGEPPYSIRLLAHHCAVSPIDIDYYLERLQQGGLVSYTHFGPSVVTLRKAPAVTKVSDVLAALYGKNVESGRAAGIVRRFFRNGTVPFDDVSVLDIVSGMDGDGS